MLIIGAVDQGSCNSCVARCSGHERLAGSPLQEAQFQLKPARVRTPLRSTGRRFYLPQDLISSQSYWTSKIAQRPPPSITRFQSQRLRNTTHEVCCHPIQFCTVRVRNTALYKPPCIRPWLPPHLHFVPFLAPAHPLAVSPSYPPYANTLSKMRFAVAASTLALAAAAMAQSNTIVRTHLTHILAHAHLTMHAPLTGQGR